MPFVTFPGLRSSGDQVLGEHTVPGVLCILINSLVPAAWFPGCAVRTPFQVCCVSPLGSWSLAATLLGRTMGCTMSTVQDPRKSWLATGRLLSLVEDATSGVEVAPWLLALALTCLPLCLQQREGLVCSRLALLWYSLSPLFYEQARLCLRLELFVWKLSLSLFFFFSLPQFWLLSHISSLKLSLGHSGLVLTLSMQPKPPRPAPSCWWWMWASGPLLG